MRGPRPLLGSLALLALTGAACHLRGPAAAIDSPGRAIALHYDTTLAAAGFPNPLLRVTIGTRRVWFIIDTGAGVHTMAAWLVNAAGLTTRQSSATVTGSTGAEQRVRALGPVRGRLDDGRTLSIPEAVVVEFPPLFQEHEIGGLLSPQLLASGDAVVLDLTAPSMTIAPQAAALARVGGADATARVCRNGESQFRNRLYGVQVTAAGTPASLLVDSGATRTVAADQSLVARQLAARAVSGSQTQGVGGVVTSLRRIPGITLSIDGATTTVDLALGPVAGTCGEDGLLGMDALTHCVLVLGESAFGWSCRPDD
jgi:aspartyl protease